MGKKIISIILIGCMLLSATTVFAEDMGEGAWKAKVEQAVLNDISNGFGKIEVYLFLVDLEDGEITEKLKEAGIDEAFYTNSDYFERLTAQEVDEYIQKKREIIRNLCEESNALFIEENGIDEQDILYNSMYSKTLIVKATPEEIQKYANSKEVDLICKYEQMEQSPDTDSIQDTNETMNQTAVAYYGDFDGDKKVTLNDVICCLRFSLGIAEPTKAQLLCGDLDGGGISLSDTTEFLNMALAIEDMKLIV